MTKRLFPLILLTLAACGDGIQAPSLLPRAIEKQVGASRPVPPPVNAAPIDPALQRQLGELMGRVKEGDSAFTTADQTSARLITAGRTAAEGSEAWVVGQQAQSVMEAARQNSAAALAEIENLLLAQTQAAASDPKLGGIAELSAAESAAGTIVARQTTRLQELTR
ncbi:hypothetical protein BH09PSE3_BH09PSE3_07390 [soil metagenome]